MLSALGLACLGMALVDCGSEPKTEIVTPATDSRTPAVTVSKETTYITAPLMPDGTPDYAAFLNARLGEGVTPEENAAALIAPVVGMKLDDRILESMGVDPESARSGPRLMGNVLWDDFDAYLMSKGDDGSKLSSCARRAIYEAFLDEGLRTEERGPCSAQDCPATAEWIDANEAALSVIERATHKSGYFIPMEEGKNLAAQGIPGLLGQRTAAEALRARAMLALGRGAWSDAADDVLTAYRLSAFTSEGGTAIEKLIATSQRGLASDALTWLASSPRLRADDASELLTELRKTREFSFDFTTERLIGLATVIRLWQAGSSDHWREVLEPGGDPTDFIADGLYSVPSDAVDWNEALRIVNRAWERVEGSAGVGDANWESRLEEPTLGRLLDRLAHDPEARLELTQAVVAGAGLLPTWLDRTRLSLRESHAKSRFAIVSLAAAIFRAEYGRWPDGFHELRESPPDEASGYVSRFHVIDVDRIAITASPQNPGGTARYGFCWDGTGGMLVTYDGSEPEILGGRCHRARHSKSSASSGRPRWLLAGVVGLLLTVVLAAASRPFDTPNVLVCALAFGAMLIGVGARATRFYTFASPRVPEVKAEISRAKTVAARLPEFRREVESQEETSMELAKLLPTSLEAEYFEERIREWAAEPGFTVEGTWLDKDFTPHHRAQLTVCVADDRTAAVRLSELRYALPKAVRFIEGRRTNEGAEVVVEWFALAREKPKKRRTEELCQRVEDSWSLGVTREMRDVCAEWKYLRPVVRQIVEFDDDRRDLERRQRTLEKIRERDSHLCYER